MSLSDNFMQELSTNPEFDSLRGLLAWMQSFLDACPRHLKKCMMYLSIFPPDIIVRRRRLIRRWIAEGYFKGIDIDSISMEKSAEKMFGEIAALSIMQPVMQEATKVIGYRVNGFFHEYIMSRPAEDTIFFPVEVSRLEMGHGGHLAEGIGQHLAIGRTWESDHVFLESLDFSRLRSLTVFGMLYRQFYVSDRMRVLRVLDLENDSDLSDLYFEINGPQWKLPSCLKFLSLRGQSRITRLPDLVGELVQLQTLDIRDTSILTLPPFITRLRKLQCIRAGTTISWADHDDTSSSSDDLEGMMQLLRSRRSHTLASCFPKPSKFLLRRRAPVSVIGSRGNGVEVPAGISRLKALQTLGTVCLNTADGGDDIVYKILFLPQLKKLQVSGINGKNGHTLQVLDYRPHLESLTLQFDKNNSSVCWEKIIPTSLRSLKMIGPVEHRTQGIERAVNLGKLTLQMTNQLFTADDIQRLGSLPSLRTLRLRVRMDEDRQQDGELRFPTDLFSRLQVFEFACCRCKLDVRFDEGAMEKLEHLKVHFLEGSQMQISGLEHLVSLEQVWLLRSFDDALKEAVLQQLAKHPKKPAPKLEVQTGSSQASRS